jgi:pyruvate formate lyase activating enzyme
MCGDCVSTCPTGALEIIGRNASAEEVIQEVLRDRVFYENSGGGMTLSGGEPALQPDFSYALLALAREHELHTCLDTCGFCDFEILGRLLPLVDLIYYDIKETDPQRHEEFTGVGNARILENLGRLDAAGAVTQLRCPIVPGLNDRPEHFEALAKLAQGLSGCLGVELLAYHRLGQSKRERLAMPPVDARIGTQPPSAEVLAGWKEQIASHGARAL